MDKSPYPLLIQFYRNEVSREKINTSSGIFLCTSGTCYFCSSPVRLDRDCFQVLPQTLSQIEVWASTSIQVFQSEPRHDKFLYAQGHCPGVLHSLLQNGSDFHLGYSFILRSILYNILRYHVCPLDTTIPRTLQLAKWKSKQTQMQVRQGRAMLIK